MDMSKYSEESRLLAFGVLIRISIALCALWLIGTTANVLVHAQQQQRYNAPSFVTEAEHEKLKAEVISADDAQRLEIAVLSQQVKDMSETVGRNTNRLNEVVTTINREEGLGMAFGLALGLVQWWLYRTHVETVSRIKDTNKKP